MAQISINNGNSYCTIDEALQAYSIDVWAGYMDDEIREAVHNDLAPCSDAEFLAAYLAKATNDLIIG